MTTPKTASPVMSLESVTRDYRQGDETIHALHSTDLQLRAGELVGILGPSGSGKSTLLTVMGGLHPLQRHRHHLGRAVLRPTGEAPGRDPAPTYWIRPSGLRPGALPEAQRPVRHA